ncbi:TetR/AcrR family transcriptional regulator [Streptomyces samsunensis]|uniref:HTH tetR-type domain-containing protein n=4 Tax=Streptomyces malaysiensis TaxID=92644 RepID=A0A2J7Z406_STRMQ|nr:MULTISPECIES: TetR/AcrR family transcriptional regulator [Streptomyces]MCC4314236.1 TetR/AcrR family transcriptional regulator [Streptomyces malaysiensis]MCD9587476.1 TetR/AcrR family transcriptional regulator [Streptomyces sp. 8ZJF_21]MCM3804711.1 TetR/AcrR family transcriptional regulator [Streptomyces sp. DR7-3]MCQ6245389.1 TetR/AcrR family transcriptional regulator [Streptomyces malaysiensis]MCQ8833323.1 TetR/AcrR family transcriptional regulator [Streptomyces samsunensis]
MVRDPGRPLRADAQRNREKILSAAVRIFAEEGLNAHLERIAKEAGVGTGTLYRNFPTRELLIEAAYRNELARLCDAAPELLAALPPREAMRVWLGRFMDYANAKLGMADALRGVVASGVNPYAQSHEMIQDALSLLMDAAVTAGVIRSDISATDMFAALTGIALASGKPEQREQADRLLDLTLDGLSAGSGR